MNLEWIEVKSGDAASNAAALVKARIEKPG
jgi:hypothetical protein